ncbi:MAG TPA: hypothetical protein VHG10_00610 [Glycomyces sp.]|nr:hypothetical protein [Glycomyces sp.]
MEYVHTQMAAPVVNLGPLAQMYGTLAATLAGFAFAALVIYLERQSNHGETPSVEVSSSKYGHVEPASIVKTLFYAMCALTVCAFLYARLAGESAPSGRVLLALSLFGMVLATAVLSLFYALNLVMTTHELTRPSAEATRWVVAAAGPSLAIALLADLFDSAWKLGCAGGCAAWMSPRWWSFAFGCVLLLVGMLLTMPVMRRVRGLGEAIEWLLRRRPIRAGSDSLVLRPHFPALVSVVFAVLVGGTTLWVDGLTPASGDGPDPRLWVHPVLILTSVVMATFAFTSGSVLDPAPTAPLGRRRFNECELEFRAVNLLSRVRVVEVGTGHVLGTVVRPDTNQAQLRPWNPSVVRRAGFAPADLDEVTATAKLLWAKHLEADR